MEYFNARKIILSYGWEPLGGPCQGAGIDEEVCRAFPEVGNCSGTGVGFCDMHFARKDRCLDVVTTGGAPSNDGPGDTSVRDVAFGSAPCSKGVD